MRRKPIYRQYCPEKDCECSYYMGGCCAPHGCRFPIEACPVCGAVRVCRCRHNTSPMCAECKRTARNAKANAYWHTRIEAKHAADSNYFPPYKDGDRTADGHYKETINGQTVEYDMQPITAEQMDDAGAFALANAITSAAIADYTFAVMNGYTGTEKAITEFFDSYMYGLFPSPSKDGMLRSIRWRIPLESPPPKQKRRGRDCVVCGAEIYGGQGNQVCVPCHYGVRNRTGARGTCSKCGKFIFTRSAAATLCAKCKKDNNRLSPKPSTVKDIAKAAKKEGLSYGEYVARQTNEQR